eukprot:1766839-Ditylum_brightwellii.AAC.2
MLLQALPNAGKPYLLDLLFGTNCTQNQVLEQPTCKKYTHDWARWKVYVVHLGLPDIYMRTFSQNKKLRLLQVCMEAVLCRDFTQGSKKPVKGSTAREALDYIYAVLEESGWGNPSKTPAGKLKLTLGQ